MLDVAEVIYAEGVVDGDLMPIIDKRMLKKIRKYVKTLEPQMESARELGVSLRKGLWDKDNEKWTHGQDHVGGPGEDGDEDSE